MKLRRLVVGSFATNCYIYYDETKAFIIDPGDQAKKIKDFINENQLNVVAVFLTHGHIDHIGALQDIYNTYHCDVYIHKEDACCITNASDNLSTQFGFPMQLNVPVLYYEEEMVIANKRLKIHHTPGHTPGSVMIEFVDDHVIFSGDMLFNHSIGRYDFPRSSAHDMKESVKYIGALDYECHVLPGHDAPTTLQTEIKENPFFIQILKRG